MMNVNEIAELIDNPNMVKEAHVDSLSNLAQKYPYSQLFSILYLNGLKRKNDIRFEEELPKHSFRISDRVQLFHLINKKTDQLELSVDDDFVTEPKQSIQEVEIPTKEIIVESNIKPSESEENIEINVESEELEGIKEDESFEIEFEIPEDPLDKTILSHVLSSNYQLGDLTKEELETIESRDTSESLELPEIKETDKIKDPIELDTKQSFGAWLHSNKNYTEPDNDEKLYIESINSSNTIEEETLFGEAEKPKKEFFSPTKKAKESLDESILPVSETLAKIYAVQGNYPKAISAYKQLSLNYPEKKIFFANQITELTKKLNT